MALPAPPTEKIPRAPRLRLGDLVRVQRTGVLRRLKVDTDPASDKRPVEIPCVCGEVHRVTVSPYRRRRSSDEAFDLEVVSLDELRSDS